MLRRVDVPATALVAEGEIPAEAYRLHRPWSTVLTSVFLVVGSVYFLTLGTPSTTLLGGLGLAMGSLVLVSRPLMLWRYGRARQRGHDFWNRIALSDDGIVNTWRVAGEEKTRHYDWFLFSSHVVEPHRIVIWLRVARAPGGRPEVVVLPRALFGDRFDEACAIVAQHVARAAPTPPTRPASWKAIALWVVLLVGLLLVYQWTHDG
jgi:hypothetical protein